MILQCYGSGMRPRRRFVVAMCVALLVVSVVPCVLTSGCGDNAAKSYLALANQIVYEVNTKAGELKKYWALPLAEQADFSKTLAEFRKLLGSSQDRLDSAHPPLDCLDLDEKMRKVVEAGRDLAEAYSPFADYFVGAAPLAKQLSETVASLRQFQKSKDTASSLTGLTETMMNIGVKARSMTPPEIFTGMHEEFKNFIQSLVTTFENASGQGEEGSQRSNYSNTEPYNEEDGNVIPAPEDEQTTASRRTTLPGGLGNVPADWDGFNAELTNIIAGVQDILGVKTRNDTFETLVGQAVAEIKRLETKHK
jgi:hypothetical protein